MKITPEQVAIGEDLSRLVMAWIAFLATLIATAVLLTLLVWCVLEGKHWEATVIVGVVNGFLLTLLIIIFRYIFNRRSPKPGKPPSAKGKTGAPQ
jgi:ABC-type nickel/cobalt efflux system permease component RcnA